MMWVCVSDVFNVRLICEKIVESATDTTCERLQMDGVKKELKNAIDGRKYLLVLDDVWNECPVKWMELEELLSSGARGSKILITARAESVSRAAKSIGTHFLRGLSHEESWALFKKVAFKREAETRSTRIVEIGEEVVKICAGVPLAVKTIGSMLGLKEKETDWFDFQKNVLPLVTQDSEGYVVPILKLSYDFLSAPLKRCFVHCAILPKDYKFDKERLIGMWMAQGLIQLDGTSRSIEDVGKQHFMDLLDRSFFEKDHILPRLVGDVCMYKMHDLIHDLALSIGGNEYYNIGSDANCIDILTRHAWVPLHVTAKLFHAKQLRTLVVTDSHDVGGHKTNEIMSVFTKLRLLDLANLKMTRVPHAIQGLTQLSYLNLSSNFFYTLPESICSLYNLQTLILRWCGNLRELPLGTRNLVSLRHLDIHGCSYISGYPLFVADRSDEDGKQFMKLLSLRVVEIRGQEMVTLPAWLQFLPHLQTLEISHCDRIVRLPQWMDNLTSLEGIHLRYCKELASIPNCIQRLTSLKRLVVVGCDKLLGRCKEETGEDWHKISHIPDIKVMKYHY